MNNPSHNSQNLKGKTEQNEAVLIAGGSGFIGRHLAVHLCNLGYRVYVVGRDITKIQKLIPFATAFNWDDLAGWNASAKNASSLPQFTVIINLAGHSIAAGRWTQANKQRLIDSRINTVQNLMSFCEYTQFNGLFINASAVGFYGNQGDEELTESFKPEYNAALKNDFSHALCTAWESALAPVAKNSNIRLCIARFGVVLSGDGGAFVQMSLPFKAKLAVQNGDGKQWFSWIALDDAISALAFLVNNKTAQGTFNIVAPNPLTNAMLTQLMAKHYNTLITLPAPAGVLRLVMGQMADELLLASLRVLPKQLQDHGFEFKYTDFALWLKSL